MFCLFAPFTGVLSIISSLWFRIRLWFAINHLDYIKRDFRDPDMSSFTLYIFPMVLWPVLAVSWTINGIGTIILCLLDTKRIWSVYNKKERSPYLYLLFTSSHPYNRIFKIAIYLWVMVLWINFCFFLQRKYIPMANDLSMGNSFFTLVFGGGLPVFFEHGRAYASFFMPQMMILSLKTILFGTIVAQTKQHMWDNVANNFARLNDGVFCGGKFAKELFEKTSFTYDDRTEKEKAKNPDKYTQTKSIVLRPSDGTLTSLLDFGIKVKKIVDSTTRGVGMVLTKLSQWIKRGFEFLIDLLPKSMSKLKEFLEKKFNEFLQTIYGYLKKLFAKLQHFLNGFVGKLKKLLDLTFKSNHIQSFTETSNKKLKVYIESVTVGFGTKHPWLYLFYLSILWLYNRVYFFTTTMIVFSMFMFIFRYRFQAGFANDYLTKEFDDYNRKQMEEENRENIYPLTVAESQIYTRYDRLTYGLSEFLSAAASFGSAHWFLLYVIFVFIVDKSVYTLMVFINEGMSKLIQDFSKTIKEDFVNFNLFGGAIKGDASKLYSDIEMLRNTLQRCFEYPSFRYDRYIAPLIAIIALYSVAFIEPYVYRFAVMTCDELFPERVRIRAQYLYHNIVFRRIISNMILTLLGFYMWAKLFNFFFQGMDEPEKTKLFCYKCNAELTNIEAYEVVTCPIKICQGINCLSCLKPNNDKCLKCSQKLHIDSFFHCKTMMDFELQERFN